MVTTALGDVGIANVILGGVATMLTAFVGFVLRAIAKGDLKPKSQVDELVAAEQRGRVTDQKRLDAQAEALTAASDLIAGQAKVISDQADSIRDFAEASHLQVRVAEELHKNLQRPGGDV